MGFNQSGMTVAVRPMPSTKLEQESDDAPQLPPPPTGITLPRVKCHVTGGTDHLAKAVKIEEYPIPSMEQRKKEECLVCINNLLTDSHCQRAASGSSEEGK
ncbi:uncharacterized protein TM35_000282210 [Trypanosoma theileri]|uniref:Uncharacterized protein n=1 Tax=Trypanosoma theileri TaxID=67003 RepID=A0A1X0NP81_9TRYP|nr:uncharacterized protein TM35_000282210 [Trypanosoma theileri]ORC86505.1 hypothetical protein TM35_000282210 [Trypanosoma theileri]